jgi:hypothetical protein
LEVYNIFKLAELNKAYLSREYEKILDKLNNSDKTKIKRIENKVKNDLKISMNTDMWGLSGFLKDGIYKNVHDLVEEGIKKLKNKKEKEDYEKRKYFDFMFEEGRKFKYGALYIDGCGVKEYGYFYIVISGKELKNLCFLKYDCLKNYVVEENGKYCLKENELKRDLSDKDHVHYLAIIKHYEDIINKNDEEIMFTICGDDYIEAITTDDITPKKVIKIGFLVYKEYRKALEENDLECECDIITLLENILTLMDDDILERYKLKSSNEDVKKMTELIEILKNQDSIIFEVYVEYDDEKNPKKVWCNESNSN